MDCTTRTEGKRPPVALKPCVFIGGYPVYQASGCRRKAADLKGDTSRIRACVSVLTVHRDNGIKGGDPVSADPAEDKGLHFIEEEFLFSSFDNS